MFGGGGGVSGDARLENANPRLREAVGKRQVTSDELDEEVTDAIDDREVNLPPTYLTSGFKIWHKVKRALGM